MVNRKGCPPKAPPPAPPRPKPSQSKDTRDGKDSIKPGMITSEELQSMTRFVQMLVFGAWAVREIVFDGYMPLGWTMAALFAWEALSLIGSKRG